MDEQTIQIFQDMGDHIKVIAEMMAIAMLASDKYTVYVKTYLLDILGYLNVPLNPSLITGKDETELLEMMMNNNGGNDDNGGYTEPENPATPK